MLKRGHSVPNWKKNRYEWVTLVKENNQWF